VPAPTVTTVPPSAFAEAASRVRSLDDAVHAARGNVALGDSVWRDLAQPDPDSLLLFADGDGTGSDPEGTEHDALVHVARSDNFSPRHWALGIAYMPPGDAATIRALLEAAAAHVAARGGGRMVGWVFAAQPSDDALLANAEFTPARDLYEMHVALPLAERPEWPAGIEVRDFEPGRDDAAWLAVNNRAFANHPEQGDWIEATLQRRLAEDWFDPKLFVLAFDEEGLAGFNWCKYEPPVAATPAVGEIWVIGVDPRVAGRRIGRPLAVEGLARLHERGVTTGSLFTNADNERAIKLYRSLGFDVHRTDRSYAREVAPT
jgi:mycothiol synthase